MPCWAWPKNEVFQGHYFLDNFTENWTLIFLGIQPFQGAKNTIYTHPNFCEKTVKKDMIFYFYYWYLTRSSPETYPGTHKQTSPLPQIYRCRTMVRRVAISNVIIPFHINLRWISSLLLHFWSRSVNWVVLEQQLLPHSSSSSSNHSYIDLGME